MSRPSACTLALLTVWAVVLGVSPAFARPLKVAPPPSPPARAAALVGQGVMALATRDFAAAYRDFAAAYRLQPSADTLFQLGITAWSQGQNLNAQDILRRYLAAATATDNSDKRSEAQRIVEQSARGAAEAWVQGAERAFVVVDDRLVGQLPLPLPLLLSAGAHRLRLEAENSSAQTVEFSLRAEQAIVARQSATGLTITALPKVFLHLPTGSAASDAAARQALLSRLATLMLAQDLAPATATTAANPQASCDVACLLPWAKEQAADFIVDIVADGRAASSPASDAHIAIIDVALEEVAAQQSLAADPAQGGPEAWLTVLPALLQKARARGRGTLHVTTTPAGCEVRSGGRLLGTTPLQRPLFAGSLDIEIAHPGLVSERRRIDIAANETTPLDIALHPPPVLPPITQSPLPSRKKRPTWRLLVGASALVVGVGLGALGVSGLAVSGRCIDAIAPPVQACPRFYETATAGGVLVGVGAALSLSGGLLLAWPGPKPSPAVAARKGD